MWFSCIDSPESGCKIYIFPFPIYKLQKRMLRNLPAIKIPICLGEVCLTVVPIIMQELLIVWKCNLFQFQYRDTGYFFLSLINLQTQASSSVTSVFCLDSNNFKFICINFRVPWAKLYPLENTQLPQTFS